MRLRRARARPSAVPDRTDRTPLRRDDAPAGPGLPRGDLLSWLYLARLVVAAGLLAGSLAVWRRADPELALLGTLLAGSALLVTLASAWYTHLAGRTPGETFLYGHVIFDVLLVTGIIHLTGGHESNLSPLYVLVITEGALLLPFPGGALMGGLAIVLYVGDLFWLQPDAFSGVVAYQIALFAAVALVTAFLGDRVRRAGLALVAVESELRRLRLDTSDILASINTGVLTTNAAGRLVYLNPAGEALLGLESRQYLGEPVLEALDRIAPGMGMVLRRSIEDGVPTRRFSCAAERGGRTLVLGVSTTVLGGEEGRPRSATALFQDISDLERVEALNRRAEKLEAVAELSASLAHEIKNPLASIRSAVEQIAKPTLAPEDRDMLQRLVVKESDRLSRLLGGFLEFSGLTVGSRELLDLREVVRECVALLRQQPGSERTSVELRLDKTPQMVRGDRDLLHRAIFNLVLNAVQFSGEGGKVTVSVRPHSKKRGVQAAEAVRLVVRDDGPGIAPEELPRIFDPFYTTRPGGSGLGLAVVHRAVVAHGGTVVAEAAPAGGAEFVVDLPRASASSPAPVLQGEPS